MRTLTWRMTTLGTSGRPFHPTVMFVLFLSCFFQRLDVYFVSIVTVENVASWKNGTSWAMAMAPLEDAVETCCAGVK